MQNHKNMHITWPFTAVHTGPLWACMSDFGIYHIHVIKSPLNAHIEVYSGARDLILVLAFLYFHSSFMPEAKALVRLCICAGSSEPLQLTMQ